MKTLPQNFQILLLFFVCVGVQLTFAQTSDDDKKTAAAQPPEGAVYANEQRASRLVRMRDEINAVQDPPQRCYLRLQVVKFIFDRKVTRFYDDGAALATDCLADMTNNFDWFSTDDIRDWKLNCFYYSGKFSAAAGNNLQNKYAALGITSEQAAANAGKDRNAEIKRLQAGIVSGKIRTQIALLTNVLLVVNSTVRDDLLNAVLNFYETRPDINDRDKIALVALSQPFVSEATSTDIKQRYLSMVLRLAEKAFVDREETPLLTLSIRLLEDSRPQLQELFPDKLARALLLLSSLKETIATQSNEQNELLRGTYFRPEKEKMDALIEIANATRNKYFRQQFIWQIAGMALDAREFKKAFELVMSVDAYHDEDFTFYRDTFLVNQVLRGALAFNDMDTAELVLKNVNSNDIRGYAYYRIAARSVELDKLREASAALDSCWRSLESETSFSLDVKIDHLTSAVLLTNKIDKNRTLDRARALIVIINNAPQPHPERTSDPDHRKPFKNNLLKSISTSIENLFSFLARENFDQAGKLSAAIRNRGWRVAAQIAVELQSPDNLRDVK
ncbi:MAG TPA: hypothetical protein VGO50_18740 [Pyrinomonadaceae bacterium]|nr:hypothetical protein [Pyrinomonadaceae bacterium]